MKRKTLGETMPATRVRETVPRDIDRLVEIEFETFHDVYNAKPADPEQVRAMIATRLTIIQDLMIVGEVDGVIEGVMASQRTNHTVHDVKSWEETTNNGTLVGTHVPDGRNLYVVNLAVTQKGVASKISDQLIASTIGKLIEAGCDEAQLLSRIPQFSQWLDEQRIDFHSLSVEEQDRLAELYVNSTKIVDGKVRRYDGLLQRYMDVGVKPRAVLRDSYTDPSSLNYEVLCTYDNPLPQRLQKSRPAAILAGKALQFAANHPSLLSKFF